MFAKSNLEPQFEPRLAQFRHKMALRVIAICSTCVLFSLVLGCLPGSPIPAIHQFNNLVFFSYTVLNYLVLRKYPVLLTSVGISMSISMLIILTLAGYFVQADKYALVWHFAGIGGIYLVAGWRAGLVMTAGSIISVLIVSYFLKTFSPGEVATLCGALLASSAILFVFDRQVQQSITELTEAGIALHEMAHRDGLTGLLNRKSFEKAIGQFIADKTHFSLVMMDLDHFKSINDRFGHAGGDAVLRHVGSIIKTGIRKEDTGFRVGGEELVMLLPQTDLHDALVVTERMRMMLENAVISHEGRSIRLTASFGLAAWRDHESADEIVRRADAALYKAKGEGRNRLNAAA